MTGSLRGCKGAHLQIRRVEGGGIPSTVRVRGGRTQRWTSAIHEFNSLQFCHTCTLFSTIHSQAVRGSPLAFSFCLRLLHARPILHAGVAWRECDTICALFFARLSARKRASRKSFAHSFSRSFFTGYDAEQCSAILFSSAQGCPPKHSTSLAPVPRSRARARHGAEARPPGTHIIILRPVRRLRHRTQLLSCPGRTSLLPLC